MGAAEQGEDLRRFFLNRRGDPIPLVERGGCRGYSQAVGPAPDDLFYKLGKRHRRRVAVDDFDVDAGAFEYGRHTHHAQRRHQVEYRADVFHAAEPVAAVRVQEDYFHCFILRLEMYFTVSKFSIRRMRDYL